MSDAIKNIATIDLLTELFRRKELAEVELPPGWKWEANSAVHRDGTRVTVRESMAGTGAISSDRNGRRLPLSVPVAMAMFERLTRSPWGRRMIGQDDV